MSKLRLLELDLTLGDLSGALEIVGCEFRWLGQDLDDSALCRAICPLGDLPLGDLLSRRSPRRSPREETARLRRSPSEEIAQGAGNFLSVVS